MVETIKQEVVKETSVLDTTGESVSMVINANLNTNVVFAIGMDMEHINAGEVTIQSMILTQIEVTEVVIKEVGKMNMDITINDQAEMEVWRQQLKSNKTHFDHINNYLSNF